MIKRKLIVDFLMNKFSYKPCPGKFSVPGISLVPGTVPKSSPCTLKQPLYNFLYEILIIKIVKNCKNLFSSGVKKFCHFQLDGTSVYEINLTWFSWDFDFPIRKFLIVQKPSSWKCQHIISAHAIFHGSFEVFI